MRITDERRRQSDEGRHTLDAGLRWRLSLVRISPSLVHRLIAVAALSPLLIFAIRAGAGDLSINPIQEAVQISGRTALNLLILSLAITPAARLLRAPHLIPARRLLGLYAFGWAALHLLTFAVVDFGFDLPLILREFAEKAYLVAGAGALLILVPLTITSTRYWQHALGARWKMLHRGVYLAAVLALLHYWAALKPDLNDALLLYAPLLSALLLLRQPLIRRLLRPLAPRAQQQPDERT